jgi:hypothetical protein
LTAKGNTHRLSQEGGGEIGNTIIESEKRSTGKLKIAGINSAAGAVLVTLGKPVLWLFGICRVLKWTTWFGSLGLVTKITGALTVLLLGAFVSRYFDIVDVTVGTMKDGIIDGAMKELWLLMVTVGGCEVADDWKAVGVGVILGIESPFCVPVYIEVVLWVGRIPGDREFWNEDVLVEDPSVESRSKEELHWKIGSFLVVLFAVRGGRIPGLKDREMA